jgi:hypothetical protein
MSIVGTIFQGLNILILLAWLILTLVTLFQLKDRKLSATPKVLWVIVVSFLPILGAVAFFIIQPGRDQAL